MSEILGVLFALLVGMLSVPKLMGYQQASNDNSIAATTAEQQKIFNAAVTAYIKQYATSIEGTATSTSPFVISVPTLQMPAVNLLPASFGSINPYGQTWQAEVLQPTPGNLTALSLSIGGTPIKDKQAGKIASLVGAIGGMIPQNDSTIYPSGTAMAMGSASGWTESTANFTGITPGTLASLIMFDQGQLVSPYLYRNAVPGQPQLNTMAPT